MVAPDVTGGVVTGGVVTGGVVTGDVVAGGVVTGDVVVGDVVAGGVGTGDVVVGGSILRPVNVVAAPARFAEAPLASLMLAPLGTFTPLMASAAVSVSVAATVVLNTSLLVPEPLT